MWFVREVLPELEDFELRIAGSQPLKELRELVKITDKVELVENPIDMRPYFERADIIIVAIGKSKFLTKDMVKEGAVVIDVGINRGEDGKLTGDVDFENVEKVASYITPVPGGVGPMTIAMLMNNVIKATKEQYRKKSVL